MSEHVSPLQKTGRILLAGCIILIGAASEFYVADALNRLIISVAAGLFAIILLLDIRAQKRSNPQAAAPILASELHDITIHEDFQRLIDSFLDPVMVVEGHTVINANISAHNLLGQHIVNEDVRLAIRHPSVADIFSPSSLSETSRPMMLVGIGSRDQRWEMRVKNLGADKKLLFLWDQSGSHAVERMRTDFVANASHELRTPLSSIKGFIETLEEDGAGSDAKLRKRFLGVMMGEAERMQKLIDDLISLSRIESERFKSPVTPIDFPKLIAEVRDVLVQSQPDRGADIALDIQDDLEPIMGDHAQLSQLLHNLINNSMKYGSKGTPIAVSLSRSRNGAMQRLVIADQGEGIAPQHLPRLTERFYRVDSGRSRSMGGTGLGLSIVKHIVERHRGRFDLTSEQDKGTTITISLPIAKADRQIAGEPQKAPEIN